MTSPASATRPALRHWSRRGGEAAGHVFSLAILGGRQRGDVADVQAALLDAGGDGVAQRLEGVADAHSLNGLLAGAHAVGIGLEIGGDGIAIAAEIAAAAGAVGKAVHPFLDAQIVDVALARGALPPR